MNRLEISKKDSVKENAFFSIFESALGMKIIPFSCGRSAMVAGLQSLRFKRMDEVFVPPFLCQAVISALSKVAFPAMMVSKRTKAILVYHQFGFPQRINLIEKIAHKNGWTIINDCCDSIFSSSDNKFVVGWGDFTVLSFPKVYSSVLGGGFISSDKKLFIAVEKYCASRRREHEPYVRRAYQTLVRYQKNPLNEAKDIEIAGVYGFLPMVVAFPEQSLRFLPQTSSAIKEDILRRKNFLKIIADYFPSGVPDIRRCDVVPSAVPVFVKGKDLALLSNKIKKSLGFEVPVLHFDYERNIFKPNYQKSLVISCGKNFTQANIVEICEFISKEIRK